ncbi:MULTISPECIES: efflux RND transporter periplasmic adaptor subunit [unclassified Methylobacterium]|uniref:efflux RND transporter periplasmic adaptor subunit n=1 Tax=unclassified Methylobacterium TaxID=2615210 RepID=UPI0007017199|nr:MULTISPECIES: efflux RND transporter periplasmic adaptor subunit [unclassified Methylobacterium]KQO61137.1 acriflavin resistance protein [Methylobacterium sp. Leaf86]KQO88178.1 acriflavin resistance protein [Methylobacterium sp. Leaf91]
MSGLTKSIRRIRGAGAVTLLGLAVSASLPASAKEAEDVSAAGAAKQSLAIVRTAKAERSTISADLVFTGDIQAQSQVNVAFRNNGKIATRLVEVGDHVTADQVLAKLDPQEQRANLNNAQAALTSAEALLTQAKVNFKRQEMLLSSGYTTRPSYDDAEQQLRTTQASVESAKAALGTAQEQFSYTDLKSGVDGIVLSRSFEVGQVVQAGQTVLTMAEDGPRDAVFNVFEAVLATPPESKPIDVTLQADPKVRTVGTVREISPSVDAASGTVRVKVGLKDTPAAMTLGAIVVGTGKFRPQTAIVLPWSSLYRWENAPAVWVRDPASGKVAPRNVTIDRYSPNTIALSGGVEPGEEVVIAGIQFLRPGQTVSVAEEIGR